MEPVGKPLMFLGEEDIKHAAVSFLKTHYKYRPRSGETKVQLDMRGEGGIVADGMLRFPKEDGGFFTATVEATARETKEEVFYRIQRTLLVWDAVTFSLLCTTTMVVWTHFDGTYALHTDGIHWRVFSMLACLVGSFLFYQLFFRRQFRYHYIYAIEQFKRYHADEQWIAIGEDVFAPDETKYKEELREQCVNNGFGMIVIHPDRTARLLATPAKEQLLKRKMVNFIGLDDLRSNFRTSGYTKWLAAFNGNLKNWIAPVIGETQRFKRHYYHQQMLCVLAISVISGMLYLEWTKRPVVYVDEILHESEMEAKQSSLDGEPRTLIIDAPVVPFNADFELSDLVEIDLTEHSSSEAQQGEIILSINGGEDILYYDCERFYRSDTDHFLLVYRLSGDLTSAMRDLRELAARNIDSGAIWEGCFSAAQSYYVFVDQMMSDSIVAASRAQLYEDNFDLQLSIKRVEPNFK
ncbi:MAG: hypothetical protein HRU41_22200 [Saprospiraceae bacterium]|nr:hypothetical protein [Saprospiraceae bacterium]